MTGAVVLSTVRTPVRRYGVATMCVGVGQGQAALFEV
jgi:acetyl-CoA acetyltransferase